MLTKVPAFAAHSAANKPAKPRPATAKKPSREVVLQTVKEEDEDYVLL